MEIILKRIPELSAKGVYIPKAAEFQQFRTIAGVLCPLPVGIIAGIIKGIGASIWTGQPYIEIPAGMETP